MLRLFKYNLVKRCHYCGHLFQQDKQNCPYCNREIDLGDIRSREEAETALYPMMALNINWKKTALIAAIIFGILLAVFLVFSLLKNCSKPSKEETVEESQPMLSTQQMDWTGVFVNKGKRSPVKLNFEERDGLINDCVYTNVSKGGLTMSLTGIKDGDTYTFTGHDGGYPLEIKVTETSSGHYEGYASGQFEAKAIFDRDSESSVENDSNDVAVSKSSRYGSHIVLTGVLNGDNVEFNLNRTQGDRVVGNFINYTMGVNWGVSGIFTDSHFSLSTTGRTNWSFFADFDGSNFVGRSTNGRITYNMIVN